MTEERHESQVAAMLHGWLRTSLVDLEQLAPTGDDGQRTINMAVLVNAVAHPSLSSGEAALLRVAASLILNRTLSGDWVDDFWHLDKNCRLVTASLLMSGSLERG